MKKFSAKDIRFIQKNLLKWFAANQRPLPWRKTYDPYQVWISEIMLQQTQVKTALPYFERWMKRLPTIRSVVEASEDTVLKLWEGLGYYSRARNLHKAARVIMEKHGGQFPSRYEDILALPGVGRYTAGAIASIGFQKPYPVLDGNVIRVFSRLLNFGGNTRLPKNIALLWKRAAELLPVGHARDFNQALMELGALVCTPKNAECEVCPVQKICSAYKAGTVEQIPDRGDSPASESLRVAVAVIRKGKKVFIQKRSPHGLMAGLWEFPGGKIQPGEGVQAGLRREIQEELGIKLKNIRPIARIKHAYTRFQVDLHCFFAEPGAGKLRLTAATEGKWVSLKNLQDYPFPAANVRLIQMIQ